MAKIKFLKKDFEKFYKINDKLLELISMFGTPVDELKDELEIEIFPNRPDLISLHGFVRSFDLFSGKQKKLKRYKVHKPLKNFKVIIHPSVKDIRPFTACAIVKGLKFDDASIKELMDLQEKLHSTVGRNRKKLAIGIYPLEKLSLPIKYEAISPEKIKFVPLEFSKELNGNQILSEHPKGKEFASLLKGKNKFPIFVDSKENILSMPPIINSQYSGKVDKCTKDIFIECSGFQFEILKKTLNILLTTFADMGGEIYQMELCYPKNYSLNKRKEVSPSFKEEKMKINLRNVNSLLGLNLSEKDMAILLSKMGHSYSKGKVSIAPWRIDILHEVDLIEDIAIAYGYANFVPEIPKLATTGEEDHESLIRSKFSEILAGAGLLEASSYHLLSQEDLNKSFNKNSVKLMNSRTDLPLKL